MTQAWPISPVSKKCDDTECPICARDGRLSLNELATMTEDERAKMIAKFVSHRKLDSEPPDPCTQPQTPKTGDMPHLAAGPQSIQESKRCQ